MSSFEFVFSLFGLLLGLSLAEILTGFANTVRARRPWSRGERPAHRLGWLTPTLGLLLIIDLVSFWQNAWREKAALGVGLNPMLYVTLLAGIYYVAASLVFPRDADEWPDLDDYYMANKNVVIGAVLGVNMLVIVGYWLLHGPAFVTPAFGVVWALFISLAVGIILTRSKRVSLALLCVAISLYWMAGVIARLMA